VESRTPKEVLDLAKSVDAAFVDLRFCDFARHHAALLDADP